MTAPQQILVCGNKEPASNRLARWDKTPWNGTGWIGEPAAVQLTVHAPDWCKLATIWAVREWMKVCALEVEWESNPRPRPRGISSQGSGADWHFRNQSDHLWVGELGREYDRNTPIGSRLLDVLVKNVTQRGFDYHPSTGDAKFDAEAKQYIDELLADPKRIDAQGQYTFSQLTRMVLRDTYAAGTRSACSPPTGRWRPASAASSTRTTCWAWSWTRTAAASGTTLPTARSARSVRRLSTEVVTSSASSLPFFGAAGDAPDCNKRQD